MLRRSFLYDDVVGYFTAGDVDSLRSMKIAAQNYKNANSPEMLEFKRNFFAVVYGAKWTDDLHGLEGLGKVKDIADAYKTKGKGRALLLLGCGESIDGNGYQPSGSGDVAVVWSPTQCEVLPDGSISIVQGKARRLLDECWLVASKRLWTYPGTTISPMGRCLNKQEAIRLSYAY